MESSVVIEDITEEQEIECVVKFMSNAADSSKWQKAIMKLFEKSGNITIMDKKKTKFIFF